ncbi:MAG: hypothetical protein H7175_14815 [Burkholderiales bacterium]|nr:hypothetical protein [Anaerolineae bacterium]
MSALRNLNNIPDRAASSSDLMNVLLNKISEIEIDYTPDIKLFVTINDDKPAESDSADSQRYTVSNDL